MEQSIVNKNSVKQNKKIKSAQKLAKKYYGEKMFERVSAPKAKIRKIADITDISYLDLCGDSDTKGGVLIESKDTLIALCRENMLEGRSGNRFKTADKLENFKTPGGILIVNAVECDPGLLHDAWIYRNRAEDVVRGINILNNCFNFSDIIIGTKEPLRDKYNGIKQVKVKDRFPMGYEKTLIKTVLGMELPAEIRPTDRGILVLNIQTVLAISELAGGQNTGDIRYITVIDTSEAKGFVVRVKTGTPVNEIVEKIYKIKTDKVCVGDGALSCHRVKNDELVQQSTGFVGLGEMPDYENSRKCVGCGQCERNCPSGVNIRKIVQYSEKNGKVDAEQCSGFRADSCIGCGACTYFCHAGKDIRALVAQVKH